MKSEERIIWMAKGIIMEMKNNVMSNGNNMAIMSLNKNNGNEKWNNENEMKIKVMKTGKWKIIITGEKE